MGNTFDYWCWSAAPTKTAVTHNINLNQQFSKWNTRASSISISWELASPAEPWPHLHPTKSESVEGDSVVFVLRTLQAILTGKFENHCLQYQLAWGQRSASA